MLHGKNTASYCAGSSFPQSFQHPAQFSCGMTLPPPPPHSLPAGEKNSKSCLVSLTSPGDEAEELNAPAQRVPCQAEAGAAPELPFLPSNAAHKSPGGPIMLQSLPETSQPCTNPGFHPARCCAIIGIKMFPMETAPRGLHLVGDKRNDLEMLLTSGKM